MQSMTVNQLYEALKELKEKGLGNKQVLVSSDSEGNSFHGLWYGVEDNVEEIRYTSEVCYFEEGNKPEEVVLVS